MIIEDLNRAPLLRSDVNTNGMLYDPATGHETPGKVLSLWAEARKRVGIVELKRKNGMKFDTRASTDLYDKIRQAADDLGLLIYPSEGKGRSVIVEDGTLADVELTVVVQAIEDGSLLQVYGFGQGADNQDKAGGKAGTYAFKQALIQALLAGGTKTPKKDRIPDTDDDDTPIEGGVRAKTGKPKAPGKDEVADALKAAQDEPAYRAAVEQLKKLGPEAQVELKPIAVEAKARCVPPAAS